MDQKSLSFCSLRNIPMLGTLGSSWFSLWDEINSTLKTPYREQKEANLPNPADVSPLNGAGSSELH